MSFYGSPRHIELAGDLGVITSLQQQLNDLLFAGTEPNGLLLHPILLFCLIYRTRSGAAVVLSDFNSIHVAILRFIVGYRVQDFFPQPLAGKKDTPIIGRILRKIADRWSNARKGAEKTR